LVSCLADPDPLAFWSLVSLFGMSCHEH